MSGMGEFQAILLEGLFFLTSEPYPDSMGVTQPDYTGLAVQTTSGVRSVYDTLRPLVGQHVYFAVHHVPSDPVDVARWGGGSCLWQPAARCPFGHHEHPTRLFNLTAQGTLVYDLDHAARTGGWWVLLSDGSKVILPLVSFLPGHSARIAACSVVAAEQMRDVAMAAGMDVVRLGQRVTELRDLVADLSQIVKKKGG